MQTKDYQIRVAVPQDAQAVLAIYIPYVQNTAITFEYEVPSVTAFRERIVHTLQQYPYLVAEGKDGTILGYAYACAFKARAAYDWAAEVSIYVAQGQHGRGIGRALYEALEKCLQMQHIVNLNACIAYTEQEDAYLTPASVRFHARLGYEMVARFHSCGYKFNRWYDMVWMEKIIGSHMQEQPPVIPFPKIAAKGIAFEKPETNNL